MTGKKILTTRKKSNLCLLASLTIIFLINLSCNRKEVYYQFHEIKNTDWSKTDTLYFEIDSALIAPDTPYNISIELVTDANYPYQNIWFFAQDNIESDTLEAKSKQYMVSDEFGKWYGSGFGALHQLSLNYEQNIQFKEAKKHLIKLVHGMRDEPLKGIEKIGIKIERAHHDE